MWTESMMLALFEADEDEFHPISDGLSEEPIRNTHYCYGDFLEGSWGDGENETAFDGGIYGDGAEILRVKTGDSFVDDHGWKPDQEECLADEIRLNEDLNLDGTLKRPR